MPWASRKTLSKILAIVLLVSVVQLKRWRGGSRDVVHPNIARLRGQQGEEVVLVATVPLDLDGASERFVKLVLETVRPDVVLLEGPWQAGVTAMFRSGQWGREGVVHKRNSNWTDIGDAPAVELKAVPHKRKGLFRALRLGSTPVTEPKHSYVPVKVQSWARHLSDHLGGHVAVALQAAARVGARVHFLGPDEVLLQSFFVVEILAKQALAELLEEEHRRRRQLPDSDIDIALMRAEARVREVHARWARDAKLEAKKERQKMKAQADDQVLENVLKKLEERASRDVGLIKNALAPSSTPVRAAPKKAVVIVSAVRLDSVEEAMLKDGYESVTTSGGQQIGGN
mmetsp:Transcript_29127/g.67029  ORF Transcript_29127/g.67029 Transcript_29127/m.67029 type:complete len:342 (-) Transcript_29127:130-1155(-)